MSGDWDNLEEEPECLRDRRFFDLADQCGLPDRGTLAGATGLPAADPPYATSLVRDVETAWRTPFAELSCEQARLMLGQKMGLEVLAAPIISFIQRFPQAFISSYPGEMELMVLRAADEFLRHDPCGFRAWLGTEPAWIMAFDWSRPLRREAHEALAAARAKAGLG